MSETINGKVIGAKEFLDGRPQEVGPEHNHKLNNAAGGSDHTFEGIYANLTAGATVNFGDVCYFKAADSELYLADADATTTMPAIAMAVSSATDGNKGNFLKLGYARDDSWNWTIAGLLYVSTTGTTGNTLTQTAPSGSGDQVQIVGYAVTADIMFFNPNLMLVEIV